MSAPVRPTYGGTSALKKGDYMISTLPFDSRRALACLITALSLTGCAQSEPDEPAVSATHTKQLHLADPTNGSSAVITIQSDDQSFLEAVSADRIRLLLDGVFVAGSPTNEESEQVETPSVAELAQLSGLPDSSPESSISSSEDPSPSTAPSSDSPDYSVDVQLFGRWSLATMSVVEIATPVSSASSHDTSVHTLATPPLGWVYDHTFIRGASLGTVLAIPTSGGVSAAPRNSIWAKLYGSHCHDMTFSGGAYAGAAASVDKTAGCGTYTLGWRPVNSTSYMTSLQNRSYHHHVRTYSAAAKSRFWMGFYANCGGGKYAANLYWYTGSQFYSGCKKKVINATP